MKSYHERMKAKEQRQLALLAQSIQKTMELTKVYFFEQKYGKLHLN